MSHIVHINLTETFQDHATILPHAKENDCPGPLLHSIFITSILTPNFMLLLNLLCLLTTETSRKEK